MTTDYFSIRLPGLLNHFENNYPADWKSHVIGHIGPAEDIVDRQTSDLVKQSLRFSLAVTVIPINWTVQCLTGQEAPHETMFCYRQLCFILFWTFGICCKNFFSSLYFPVGCRTYNSS